MADSMQGAGGTPVNETKQKLAAMRESGAASEAIKDYASGNYIPELSYEYNPYVPDPIVVVPIAGQPGSGGSGGSASSNNPDMEPPDNIPTVSGNALPGLTGGYTSIADMFDGGGPGASANDLGPFGGAGSTVTDPNAYYNYGGEIEGYRNGGQIPEEEYASYMTMAPIAKTKIKEAPLAPALREQEARYDKESPWYSDMAMQLGSAAAGTALSKGVATAVGAAFPPAAPFMAALGMLPFNKGGKVCPCGTPGCPGCGKGYNHGGPIKNQNMPALYDDYFQGVHRPGRDARFMNDRLPDGSYIPEVYNRGLQYNQDRDDITMKYHGGTHMFKDDTYAGGASGPLAMAERNAQYAKYVDDIKALREQGIDAQNNKTFGQTYRADSSFAKGPSVDSTYGQMVTGYKEQVPEKGFFQSAKSYKEEIARNESDAKIRREDFKALADIKKKLKGPLQ